MPSLFAMGHPEVLRKCWACKALASAPEWGRGREQLLRLPWDTAPWGWEYLLRLCTQEAPH